MFPAQVLLATRAIFTAVGGDGRWHGNKSFAPSAWRRQTEGETIFYLATHVHLYDSLWRAKSPSNSLSSSLVKSSHNQDSLPPPTSFCSNTTTTTTPPLAHTHSGTMWEQVWLHIKNEKGKTGSLFSFSAPHPLPLLPPPHPPANLSPLPPHCETVAHCHDALSSETHHKKMGNNRSQPGRCHQNVNTDPAHTSSTYALQVGVGVGATNSWLSHIYSVRDSDLPDAEFQLLLSGACFNCSPFKTDKSKSRFTVNPHKRGQHKSDYNTNSSEFIL